MLPFPISQVGNHLTQMPRLVDINGHFSLQEVDKLLDFDYSDDDIFSLRQQMKLPVSLISMHSPSIGMTC